MSADERFKNLLWIKSAVPQTCGSCAMAAFRVMLRRKRTIALHALAAPPCNSHARTVFALPRAQTFAK